MVGPKLKMFEHVRRGLCVGVGGAPLPSRQIDRHAENITFPQLCLRAVRKSRDDTFDFSLFSSVNNPLQHCTCDGIISAEILYLRLR